MRRSFRKQPSKSRMTLWISFQILLRRHPQRQQNHITRIARLSPLLPFFIPKFPSPFLLYKLFKDLPQMHKSLRLPPLQRLPPRIAKNMCVEIISMVCAREEKIVVSLMFLPISIPKKSQIFLAKFLFVRTIWKANVLARIVVSVIPNQQMLIIMISWLTTHQQRPIYWMFWSILQISNLSNLRISFSSSVEYGIEIEEES